MTSQTLLQVFPASFDYKQDWREIKGHTNAARCSGLCCSTKHQRKENRWEAPASGAAFKCQTNTTRHRDFRHGGGRHAVMSLSQATVSLCNTISAHLTLLHMHHAWVCPHAPGPSANQASCPCGDAPAPSEPSNWSMCHLFCCLQRQKSVIEGLHQRRHGEDQDFWVLSCLCGGALGSTG